MAARGRMERRVVVRYMLRGEKEIMMVVQIPQCTYNKETIGAIYKEKSLMGCCLRRMVNRTVKLGIF